MVTPISYPLHSLTLRYLFKQKMEHDEFLREVHRRFTLAASPTAEVPPTTASSPPRKAFPTRLTAAAAGLVALILVIVWLSHSSPSPAPTTPDLGPVVAGNSWVVLKAPIDSHASPDPRRRSDTIWMAWTKLFVIAYTARETTYKTLVPDHRWAIIRASPQTSVYTPFDQLAASLTPELAYGSTNPAAAGQSHP
jgi:hypothetical protein